MNSVGFLMVMTGKDHTQTLTNDNEHQQHDDDRGSVDCDRTRCCSYGEGVCCKFEQSDQQAPNSCTYS